MNFYMTKTMVTAAILFIGLNAPSVLAEDGPAADKSNFTLFNPVPAKLMREMSADRPDKTDCPFTVDAGHFQAELDFVNITSDAPNPVRGPVRSENYQLAPMNLKIGVLNNADFQIVLAPYQWDRTKTEGSDKVEQRSGFGDVTPRVKINLSGNDGGFFAIALIPFIKLPTNQDHLGNRSVEGGLGIPFSFDVPDWDAGFQSTFNVAGNSAGSGYHAEFANSVSIGHAVIGKVSLHGEFFSSVSAEADSHWIGTFDTWFTFQADKNMCLDAGAYIGVTQAADDLHAWVGMTWRG
jgi:hypothetical protein